MQNIDGKWWLVMDWTFFRDNYLRRIIKYYLSILQINKIDEG